MSENYIPCPEYALLQERDVAPKLENLFVVAVADIMAVRHKCMNVWETLMTRQRRFKLLEES